MLALAPPIQERSGNQTNSSLGMRAVDGKQEIYLEWALYKYDTCKNNMPYSQSQVFKALNDDSYETVIEITDKQR